MKEGKAGGDDGRHGLPFCGGDACAAQPLTVKMVLLREQTGT